MPTKLYESRTPIRKGKETEDPLKIPNRIKKDLAENQSHGKDLSGNDNRFTDTNLQFKSKKVPRTTRTYKEGSKNSFQNKGLETHEINYGSSKENDEIDRLTVEEFKPGNQHLRPGYGRMCNNKKQLVPSRMICV